MWRPICVRIAAERAGVDVQRQLISPMRSIVTNEIDASPDMKMKWHVVVALSAFFGLAAVPGQEPQLNSVMHEKLEHSQKILEAVVTSDWASLDSHSRALEALTHDPRWTVLKSPEYARYSVTFVRAIAALRQAAAQRDLEKTPKAYIAMTLECVQCHRYLARERLAQ